MIAEITIQPDDVYVVKAHHILKNFEDDTFTVYHGMNKVESFNTSEKAKEFAKDYKITNGLYTEEDQLIESI